MSSTTWRSVTGMGPGAAGERVLGRGHGLGLACEQHAPTVSPAAETLRSGRTPSTRSRSGGRLRVCERLLEIGPELVDRSSRPTDSRSSPSGQRSPSHRCRDSSFVRTPPRLVAFSIVPVAVSTRRAASPWRRRTRRETRSRGSEPWSRRDDAPDARRESVRCSPCRSSLRPSVTRPRSRSHAVSAEATMPARRRVRWSRSKSASSVDGGNAGDQIVVARRAPWSRCGARRRTRARVGGAAAATRASRRRRQGQDARPRPRGRASSASGSRAPRSGSGPPRRAAAAVWSNSTVSMPQWPRWSKSCSVAVVGALRQGDRAARSGASSGRPRDRPHPSGKEQRAPALERPERRLHGDAVRVLGAGVGVRGPARRSRRRARWPSGRVAWHGSTLSAGLLWSRAAKRRGSRLGDGGNGARLTAACPSTTQPRRSLHGWRSCGTSRGTPGARRRSSASVSAASCSRGSGSSASSIPARSSSSTGSSATARWSSGCARRARGETRS